MVGGACKSGRENMSRVVNGLGGLDDLKPAAARNQILQVMHRAVFPQEAPRNANWVGPPSDDLRQIVHVVRPALSAAEVAELDRLAPAPKYAMLSTG